METTNIFLVSIFLVVIITYLGAKRFELNLQNNNSENFTICPEHPFKQPRRGILRKKDKAQQEIHPLNKHETIIDVPLSPKQVRFKVEERSWKHFYKDNYLKGSVGEDKNFEGTNFRNYLDSIKYFRN